LADFSGIIEAAKKAALSAVESKKPAGVYFGTVISASPLKINVEQNMTLESAQLILARNVTEHTIEMTIDHWTEFETTHIHTINNETAHTHAVQDTYTGGEVYTSPTSHTHTMQPTSHRHAYTGRKKFTVHNGLVNGDKVLLLRVQGGQKYVVWDRVGT